MLTREARDAEAGTFIDEAFNAPIIGLRAPLVDGAGSFFARWGGAYRSASRKLASLPRTPIPKPAEERIRLVDRLAAIHAFRARLQEEESALARTLGETWRGESTEFSRVLQLANWCSGVREIQLATAADHVIALAKDAASLATMTLALGASVPSAKVNFERVVAGTFPRDDRARLFMRRTTLTNKVSSLEQTWPDPATVAPRSGDFNYALCFRRLAALPSPFRMRELTASGKP